MTDVAAHAGVSIATVSRVLNGKPGVSAVARTQVLAALDVLGYQRPDRLQVRRQGLVGLVVPELTNPVFPAFAQAIEGMFAQESYTPLLCTQMPGGTTETEYIAVLTDYEVGGIVFVNGLNSDTTANHDHYFALRNKGINLACINGVIPELDAFFASTDDHIAMDLAVSHLVSLGHRRIGQAIGPRRFMPSMRKIEGFTAALQRLTGEDAEGHIASSLYTVEGGQAAASELLDSGHTALVCGSDLMALGAIRAARSRGLRVPEDVSIVGYDDSLVAAYADPSLTTVRQPVLQICRSVVTSLLGEIAGQDGPRGELLFAPELIVRGSTGAAP